MSFVKQSSLLLLLCLASVHGCGDSGPRKYPVKGTVIHDGKPLEFGAIMFLAHDGTAGAASIAPDGAYEAELVTGKHKVGVVANPPRQGRPDPTREGGLDTTGFPEPKPLFPPKFSQPESSGVEIEVNPTGENVIDIDLK